MLTIEFYLCGCFVGCTWLTHLSWASCVSFLLSPSVHTCICIQFHMISFKFSFSVIFPFYRHTFHRFNLNEGGLEMKLKALAWMMRSYTLHMHILVYLCVFVCKCRQMSTWRMAWGIRGQTVPSGPTAWNWPVSIKSTALSLSISLVLPSLPLSAHIHPRTDLDDLVSSFLLCVKNEIRLCEHFFQWGTNKRRFILKKTEKNMHSNLSVCSTTWYWVRLTVFCGPDLFWSYSVLILYRFFPVWNVWCLLIKHDVWTRFSGLACDPSCMKILATIYINS